MNRDSVPEHRGIARVGMLLRLLLADKSSMGMRLTELVQRAGLEKSTAHRLLSSLVSVGLVDQDQDSGRYRLGIWMVELGSAVLERLDVRTEAQSVLNGLAEAARETVHLGVARDGEVVYLEKVEGPHAIQMRSRVGHRMPLYSTGLGKAMLAFLPEVEFQRVVSNGLERRTQATIVQPARLRKELERIRLRGYSTDLEENEDGVRCVGAPVFDHTASVIAGISVAGPSFRMTEQRMQELAGQVLAAAQQISRRLGFTGSPDLWSPNEMRWEDEGRWKD